MTPQEFAAKIKAKYPQYRGIDDAELTQKVIAKYPVYAPQVQLTESDTGSNGVKGAGIGFVKRTASTLQNLGNTIAKPALKAMGVPEDQIGIPEERLKLKGTAEKVGGFVSDVAAFAVPAGKVSALAKGSGMAARMATEAALGGSITAAQEGKFDKSSRDAAIVSAAFPVLGKAFQSGRRLSQSAQKELAPRVVNSLIKPLGKDLSYGKNPGRAVAELGITANSLDDLAEKISTARKGIGEQLGEAYRASDRIFDVSDFLEPIESNIKKASNAPRTNSALIARLKALKDDLLGVEVNEFGEEVATRELQNLSAEDVFNLKRDIGDLTKFTGNASDDNTVNASLKRVYGVLKGKLDDAIPESVPLNERYADLTSAEVATKYRDKLVERQNLIKFAPKLVEVGGVIAAIASGNPLFALASLGAGVTDTLASSPRAKTEFAKWLAKTSASERRALIEKAPWLKGVILELSTD
jgi:hypothetical protein